MNSITKEQAIEKLKAQQGTDDTESAHAQADNILCQLLESLGCADVVVEYNKIDKWFA